MPQIQTNTDNQSFDSISKIIQDSGILDAKLYHFTFTQRAKEYRDTEKRYTTKISHKCLHQANYTYLWEAKAVASVIQRDLLEKEKRGDVSDWFEIEIANDMTLENYYWDITFDTLEFENVSLDNKE